MKWYFLFSLLVLGAVLRIESRILKSRDFSNVQANTFESGRATPDLQGITSADEEDEEVDEEILTNSIKKTPFVTPTRVKTNFVPLTPAKRVKPQPVRQEDPASCKLSPELVKEIASYQNVTRLIMKTVLNGAFKNRTYDDLSFFIDKFGSRITGSSNLEDSIDFMLAKMKDDDLENVHGEDVLVPHWIRGKESAELLAPRRKRIPVVGLGYTVGTPADGIVAEVLVVKTFQELRDRADEAKGKIIVFNEEYTTYGESVEYRGNGAIEAAKVGGLASLVRSVTPFSINSPHTGMQDYEQNVTQIPNACITVEDAQYLQRCQDRGWRIVLQLKMADFSLPLSKSRNVVGEIVGRDSPKEVVVVSGHIDSWDIGDGAMDDAGGAFISAEALALLKFLKLKPKRTLRSILWTGEEFGLIGVQQYVNQHRNELDQFNAVFESDIGTFDPLGLDFSGSAKAGCIVQEVLKLLEPINATMFRALPEVGSDIGFFIQKGVPGLSLNNKNSQYFWYHHSGGDTMTVESADSLDLCLVVWATTSYVLADLSVPLPRN